MAICAMESTMFGGLFGDAELAALFSDEAEIGAMIRVEAALARAEARVGVIPAAAAAEIGSVLAKANVAPEELAAGTAAAGVPVPALVSRLREIIGGDAANWVHWGATSQDVVDTALVLRLKAAMKIIEHRLGGVIALLADQARTHAGTLMAGRTRSQIATPITFGLRVANWVAPLIEHRTRLGAVNARALRVLLGGASGTNGAIAPHGPQVTKALAAELSLSATAHWGTSRAGLADLGSWLAQLSGSLGKMAGDLILMGRSEAGEAHAGAGGGSSTMPQKQNPVAAETIVALARYNAVLTGVAHLALLHQEERDATAWALEWLALPQMVVATGTALRHAAALAATIEADAARMAASIEIGGGAAMAEAASFALAAYLPRAEAQTLVKEAARKAAETAQPLRNILPALTDAPIDWEAALGTDSTTKVCHDMIELLLRGAK